ncbi:PH domain-containing protein [Sphingomonas ginsenosidivorax]|uniref:PH domain-containing protein n=1 Tax=Sphingomonas ginsenosidivorax TaxID=862135 RepID=A0A5C6UFH0_9SPHN|nr:photosynthetic complex putative assembly protein PuhB [Sphingomonas ginsenosidivorax]TXC71170.1 PH domain-containing protein [Sphingomonas ginsenosidivorax]
MTEHDDEPIPGLPGLLPPGERILWQGAPDHRVLARTAFHTRLVGGYFAVLGAWAFVGAAVEGIDGPDDLVGTAMTIIAGIVGVGLLHLLAWGSARTTLYTLTNRRVVLRIGMALPKCINLPLPLIGAVDLATHADGSGDVPLTITGRQKLGFLALWPHVRPWKIVTPQPMLRALPDAPTVAASIARQCLEVSPGGRITAPQGATDVPLFGEARAA